LVSELEFSMSMAYKRTLRIIPRFPEFL